MKPLYKILIYSFLLILSTSIFGQKNIEVFSSEKIMGKNLMTDADITGIEYSFPERVHSTYYNAKNQYLTVQLRKLSNNKKYLKNKSIFIQFDIKKQQILWSKKFRNPSIDFLQYDSTVVFTIRLHSNAYNIHTGADDWENINSMVFLDTCVDIALGHLYLKEWGYSDFIQGFDSESGAALWDREINPDFGLNEIKYLNDSTIILAAAGLHTINLKNGKGWSYHTKTGIKDYTGTIAANAVGAAIGVLTGTFIITQGHQLLRQLASNILIEDSSFVYFSSTEQFAKLNLQNGEIIWELDFPKKLAGKSHLFANDDAIFIVNEGCGKMGNNEVCFGKAFIASIDKENGNKKYLSVLGEKKDPMMDFKIKNDIITVLFADRIEKYSIQDGSLISTKKFPIESFGNIVHLIGNAVFIQSESDKLIKLNASDTSSIFVYTSMNKIIQIDNELNAIPEIPIEDIYLCYLISEKHRFMYKDKQTIIIDNEGRIIARLDISKNAYMANNKLFDKKDNHVYEIDLSKILN